MGYCSILFHNSFHLKDLKLLIAVVPILSIPKVSIISPTIYRGFLFRSLSECKNPEAAIPSIRLCFKFLQFAHPFGFTLCFFFPNPTELFFFALFLLISQSFSVQVISDPDKIYKEITNVVFHLHRFSV